MKAIFQQFWANESLKRSVGFVFGGVVYQLIFLFLSSILLARGQQSDLGSLGELVASTFLISVVVPLRLEHAISKMETGFDATAMTYSAALAAVILTIPLVLIANFFELFEGSVYLGGCLVALTALSEILFYRFVWSGQWLPVFVARLAGGVILLILGLNAKSPADLGIAFLGDRLGSFLVYCGFGYFSQHFVRIPWGGVLRNYKQERDFVGYGSIGLISTAFAAQLPVILISKYFGGSSAGVYFLAYKILDFLNMGGSLAARIAYSYYSERVRLKASLKKGVLMVVGASTGGVAVLTLLIFGVLAGASWFKLSGEVIEVAHILKFLAIGAITGTAFTITSSLLIFLDRIRILAFIQFLGASLVILSLVLGIWQGGDIFDLSAYIGVSRFLTGLAGVLAIYSCVQKFESSIAGRHSKL